MAVYLAPDDIRVNCISPGGFWRSQPEAFVKAYSETIPMGRMGQDGKEMKGAVVFLGLGGFLVLHRAQSGRSMAA